MLLKYPLKSYLYHYGLKYGLPFSTLKTVADVYDAGRSPGDFLARRQIAAETTSGSEWKGFLSRETAERRFNPGDIPGTDRLVEIGQKIFRERGGDEIVRPELNPFATLLQEEDFRNHPEIIEVALSRPILEIACDYFGTVPRLDAIDLWVTPPKTGEGEPFGSQLYHLDKPEQHYVSFFINVFDVEDEHGPFTYLPADKTAIVRRATDYEKLYYLGNGRLPDSALFRHISPDDLIRLTGPTGAGGIVDTSECLHFGSRNRSKTRVVFVLSFILAHKGGTSNFRKFRNLVTTTDPLIRMILQPPTGQA